MQRGNRKEDAGEKVPRDWGPFLVMPVELCFLDEERMELQLKKGICIQLIGG